jgi:SIR2-like domain
MLNADDQFTLPSLNRLRDAIRQKRPLVIWVGAGASRWAGLPGWHDSARLMRKAFSKQLPGFPKDIADQRLGVPDYPGVFQLCKDSDEALFNKTLVAQLSRPSPGPIYAQLVDGLKRVTPLQIVTTNVDLSLEQGIGTIDVIEPSDLERCSDAIVSRTPFVAKLHGSISSIQSTVFTSSDYRQIKESTSYIGAVKSMFSLASVLFLGYGVNDEYVLNLLSENDTEHKLFGNGPHFKLTGSPGPPVNGVFSIGYESARHGDHRGALTILEFIEQENAGSNVEVASPQRTPAATRPESGFYISDFKPSGTYTSGQFLELNNPENIRMNAIVGLGFVQGELPSTEPVGFHDLAVGLVCFDRVFLPLEAVTAFHDRASSEVFWDLMQSGAIKFVDVVHLPFYISKPESITGDISVVRVQDPEHVETRTSMSVVRKMLNPAPGKEIEGRALIESMAPHIIQFAESEPLNLAGMVRNGLLMPEVSRLLGYSDFATPHAIPRWLAYPTLRFAHLMQTGLICSQLDIRAARVPFGGVSLLSAAFSIQRSNETAFDYASFVMSGAFGSNLSAYIERNPKALLDLLKYRETNEAEALRREVADRLETNDGTEFSTAIEGSLRSAIPKALLQAARNRYSALVKANSPAASANAVWADQTAGDASLWLWRARARELLLEEARLRGVSSSSPCICGSGDLLRDCCMRPLVEDYKGPK